MWCHPPTFSNLSYCTTGHKGAHTDPSAWRGWTCESWRCGCTLRGAAWVLPSAGSGHARRMTRVSRSHWSRCPDAGCRWTRPRTAHCPPTWLAAAGRPHPHGGRNLAFQLLRRTPEMGLKKDRWPVSSQSLLVPHILLDPSWTISRVSFLKW